MTNAELIFIAIVGVFLVLIASQAKHHPQVATPMADGPKLPINQYTNGVADGNTNNVSSRVNFLQQPVGNNYS